MAILIYGRGPITPRLPAMPHRSTLTRLWLFAAAALLPVCSGCAVFRQASLPGSGDVELAEFERRAAKTIYVVGHGWHTGLVLRTDDISPAVWPEVADYLDTDALEFGWGDEGFYRTGQITPGRVTQAFLLPSSSVLHVSGFRGPVLSVYPRSDIIRIELSDRKFEELSRFISDTFTRNRDGAAVRLGPGLYGKSAFYRADGAYYFPRTCNYWTARALAAAGCPIIPLSGATAESVLVQARLSGRVLQTSQWDLKAAALRRPD